MGMLTDGYDADPNTIIRTLVSRGSRDTLTHWLHMLTV